MPPMDNLVELKLEQFDILPDHLRVISQLKRLHTLHLQFFSIDSKCESSDYERLKALKLRVLHVLDSRFDTNYFGLAHAVSYPHLRELVTNMPAIIKAIMTAPNHPLNLEELKLGCRDVDVDDLQLTDSFFARLLNLRCFHFLSSHSEVFLAKDLVVSPRHLPRLEDLQCTAKQIANFAPGRPLSRVEVLAGDRSWQIDTGRLMQPLSNATGNLNVLRMDLALFLSSKPKNYMAQVEHLRLQANGADDVSFRCHHNAIPIDLGVITQDLASAVRSIPWAQAKCLRSLDILDSPANIFRTFTRSSLAGLNLRTQHQILSEIPVAPICVRKGRIQWSRDRAGSWSVELDVSVKRELKKAQKKGTLEDGLEEQIRLHDYKGYLKTLLCSGSNFAMDSDVGSETESETESETDDDSGSEW